jgi:hypothetical protein
MPAKKKNEFQHNPMIKEGIKKIEKWQKQIPKTIIVSMTNLLPELWGRSILIKSK